MGVNERTAGWIARLVAAGGAAGAVLVAQAWRGRPRLLTWGATAGEVSGPYPGDELIPDADGGVFTMATTLPVGTLPAMYAVIARSVAARERVGTVAVTAVGMFAGGAGFGITPLSLMSLDVIVGGMSQRPRVIDGQVTIRDVLEITLAIDHNVVDGAPAARFGAEFRALLESAAVISPSN